MDKIVLIRIKDFVDVDGHKGHYVDSVPLLIKYSEKIYPTVKKLKEKIFDGFKDYMGKRQKKRKPYTLRFKSLAYRVEEFLESEDGPDGIEVIPAIEIKPTNYIKLRYENDPEK